MTEQQLERLAAVQEIQHLQARYSELCDSGYPPGKLASLFLDDAVWMRDFGDGSEPRVFSGRSQIAQNFVQASHRFPWAMHVCVPAGIVVSDDAVSANGEWRLLMPCLTSSEGGPLMFFMIAGRYRNRYAKVKDGWRFSRIEMVYDVIKAMGEGWSGDRIDKSIFETPTD